MPTYRPFGSDPASDADVAPTVSFDPLVEISPFAVFRRLREATAPPPLLVDVRTEAAPRRTLRGAIAWPGDEWEPPEGLDVVLFDDDDTVAHERARDFQARGWDRVRALFGGLELWEFALDPEVVGEDTYLVKRDGPT